MHDLIKKIRLRWVIVALAAGSLIMFCLLSRWQPGEVIRGQVLDNYACLPALFIGSDTPQPADTVRGAVCAACPPRVGMTLSYLPFFAGAHVYAIISGAPSDGYSAPYQAAIQLSSLVYLIIGLIFLHRILTLLFAEYIATLAIICICFGSNVFYFLNLAGGSAHITGFMLISLFVYYTIDWHQDRDLGASVAVGLILGLIALVRPLDLCIIIFFILYEVKSARGFSYKLKLFSKHYAQLLLVAIIAFLVHFAQPLACYLACGSVDEEGFSSVSGNSTHGTFLQGISSFRSVWPVYMPVLLFSLAGFFSLTGYMRKFFLPCIAFFLVYLAAAFIWWNTAYASSFGHRTLVDIYPVLAIPFTALLAKMINLGPQTRKVLYVLIIVFIGLNLWQTVKNGRSHLESGTAVPAAHAVR
jgi:hypothetical protein